MTSVEHTGRHRGPVTLHIETQSADIQVAADPSITGSWIELSTPDQTGPAVTAIRDAVFRDNGDTLHLTLREGQNSGGGVFISGSNYGTISVGNGTTMVNGMVIGGGMGSGPITVRAMLEPGSRLVAKTMSGDVTARGVTSVDAQTMSGGIEADGIAADSRLKSMSGDIRVYGARPGSRELGRAGGRRPYVAASTMSGDVTGEGVELSASSMSGRVRQR